MAQRGSHVVPITPDTKNWTWVVDRPCPDCGFDAARVGNDDIGRLIRANAAMWPPVLGRTDVRRRPADDKWSPLEYACHVRDVFAIYDYRLELMLTQADPEFPNWEQDQSAIEGDYLGQDPEVVAAELVEAGGRLAARFDGVSGAEWNRRGTRSDGAAFTVASFARYLLHDPVHHLWDVR